MRQNRPFQRPTVAFEGKCGKWAKTALLKDTARFVTEGKFELRFQNAIQNYKVSQPRRS
jgi:hypothetical protein